MEANFNCVKWSEAGTYLERGRRWIVIKIRTGGDKIPCDDSVLQRSFPRVGSLAKSRCYSSFRTAWGFWWNEYPALDPKNLINHNSPLPKIIAKVWRDSAHVNLFTCRFTYRQFITRGVNADLFVWLTLINLKLYREASFFMPLKRPNFVKFVRLRWRSSIMNDDGVWGCVFG